MTVIWGLLIDLQKNILYETELKSNCGREHSISEDGQLQYVNLAPQILSKWVNIIEFTK